MKSLARNEGNSVSIYIQKMKLLSSNDSTNPLDRAMDAQRLLSFLGGIFSSKATGEVFMYLLGRGATTSWLLQVDLELKEPTAYRTLKRLRALKILRETWKIPNNKDIRGGPQVKVWALLGASKEEIARAGRDHQRALTPYYRVAEEFVQYLLEEVIDKDITYMKILQEARLKLEMPTQTCRSVSQMAATILKEKGIPVWN